MRKAYKEAVKNGFRISVMKSRETKNLTQEEMADKLYISVRSYCDLEHGVSCCSCLTMLLYLIYVCEDANKFLEDLRCDFEKEETKAA